MNIGKMLRRLAGGRGGGLAPLLYARAIHRPLLVHPALGQALLSAYLRTEAETTESESPLLQVVGGIAVIDVSGPLVSRELVVPCGMSPVSYEGLSHALEEALDDPGVTAIVLRLDSPGGEANGCFEFCDQLYAARGQKPLIAVVDHMAYSAGYAIASCCDEIWISRTGGVGSVGVVVYHEDRSRANELAGVTVEYLYAGERKVDGNPNSPLSDAARASCQAEIDRLYGMFVAQVARNLGLSEQTVRATEAALFHGDRAVAAGFAHRVGTLADALASLPASGQPDPAKAPAIASVPPATSEQAESGQPNANAVVIVEACTNAGLPHLAVDFLKQGASLDAVQAQLGLAGDIRSLCVAAGRPELSAEFIGTSLSLESVRSELDRLRAASDADINHRLPVGSPKAATGSVINTADIYARRKHQP